MERLRWIGAVSALGLVLAACGSSKSFTLGDLPGIVLQPSEAPPGTTYLKDVSGPRTLDQIRNDGVRAKFSEFGFRGGYATEFATAEGRSSPGQPYPSSARHIVTSALLFKDVDGARKAFEFENTMVFRPLASGLREVSVKDLGDEAFAFTFDSFGSTPVATPGALYSFRIGNAFFVVFGGGVPPEPVKADEILAIARTMEGRARG